MAFFIYGFELSQSQILEVAPDDLIAPIGGIAIWYTYSVPEEAVNFITPLSAMLILKELILVRILLKSLVRER